MDPSAADQLVSFVSLHRDKRLWILDEDGRLDGGWYPQRIECVGERGVYRVDLGENGCGRRRAVRLDQIAAVKVELAADGSRYFGDRDRMVEAEVARWLEAAHEEDAAGHFEAALSRSQEALDLIARELGSGHAMYAQGLAGVAEALCRLGCLGPAVAHAEIACDLARERIGDREPALVAVLKVGAAVHLEVDDLETARRLAREVHDLLVVQQAAPTAIAESLAALSWIECRRGRFIAAAALAGKGLDALSPATEGTLTTRARLQHHAGMARCMSGKLEEAHPLLLESLSTRRMLLGDAHPETIEGAASLATFHLVRGDVALAVLLYRHIMGLAERVFGLDHIRVADHAVSLAIACRRLGTAEAHDEAVSLLNRSRRIRRQVGR